MYKDITVTDLKVLIDNTLSQLANKYISGRNGMTDLHKLIANILNPVLEPHGMIYDTIWCIVPISGKSGDLLSLNMVFDEDKIKSLFRRGRIKALCVKVSMEYHPDTTLQQLLALYTICEAKKQLEAQNEHVVTMQKALNQAMRIAGERGINLVELLEKWRINGGTPEIMEASIKAK